MEFKGFLLNEEKGHLGHKIKDVLTAAHDLQDDMEHMGARQIARLADAIVIRIRKILHSQWTPSQQKHLVQLQKVAVALKKAIEDKGDIKELIPAAAQELEMLSVKLGVKSSSGKDDVLSQAAELGGEDTSQTDMELTSQQDNPIFQPPQGQQPLQDPQTMGQAPPII